ncbi:MAG TPA: hypothetical protein VGF30_09530 [Bacteroidia bacterium]
MKKNRLYLAVVVLLLLLVAANAEAQCAMCKAAAESDLETNSKSIARGLNKGILFLMAIPYLIVGIIFRKELVAFIKGIKERRRVPLSKGKKQWLMFGLSVSTIWLILFLLFLRTQYA